MSWKQYGGIKNLETHKHVTTSTVIADEIILKNSYIGGFTINGILEVTGRAIIQGNLEVEGFLSADDISLNIMAVYDKSYFYGNAFFNRDISLNNNMYIGNILSVNKDVFINNNLRVGNILYLDTDQFIYADNDGIGINTMNPMFGFDISTNNMYGLKVLSNQSTNRNIMSSNVNKKGITFTTSDIDDDGGGTNTHIDFYVNNEIDFTKEGDAYIKYKNSGDLEINASNNVLVLSNMAVSNRPDEKHDQIFNESLVVYDICKNEMYNPEYYKNVNSRTGNALTLVTTDSSSNTFLRIVTPEKKGLAMGGGAYPNDLSRSMATLGITDVSGKYSQNQIIVSGSNPVRYSTTLGINNYKPFMDSYIMDVNGPVHIDNGDITIINKTNFQINSIAVSPEKNVVIGVGSSIDISGSHSDNSGNSMRYRQQIIISYDYGTNWILKDIPLEVFGRDNYKINYKLNDVYIYDNSYAFIVGDNNTLLYTKNGGTNWASTTFTKAQAETYNFKKIMVRFDSTNAYFYISGTNSTSNTVFYKGQIPISSMDGNTINIVININNLFTFSSIFINSFDVTTDGVIFLATTSGIKRLNNLFIADDVVGTPQSNYNNIKCYDNKFIAVGTNIISLYDGTHFTNTTYSNTNYEFNSLYTFNSTTSFTILNKTKIWLTKDGGYTWNEISIYDINQSGKDILITDPSNMLSNIIMTDDNTFLLTNTISTYSTTTYGKSSVINCFFPNLCNRTNNHILDLSGNMRISGDIMINDNGKIMSTNDTFYLLDENVKYLNIGNDAIELNLGNTYSGNTNIEHNLNVGMNTFMNGSLYITGIETIGNVTESSSISNGSFIVNGGVGIGKNTNIGGNLTVEKKSLFKGLSTFESDVSMNGNLFINGNTDSGNSYTGAMVVVGGVGIQGNTHILKNASVGGNLFVSSNTQLNTVEIKSVNTSTSIFSGALTVAGGVGIIENIYIGGKIDVGGTMTVRQNALFENNVKVNSVINAYDIKKDDNYLDYYFINRTTNQDVSGDKIFYGNISLLNQQESSNSNAGTLTVAGGVGIQGNLNIGGNVNIDGNVTTGKNITTYGKLFVMNNTESFSKDTGSIVTTGGLGVSGNVTIGGNVVVERNTRMNQNLSVNGNITGNIISSSIQTADNVFNFINNGITTHLNIGNHPQTTINMGSTSRIIDIGKTPFNSTNQISQSKITIGTRVDDQLPDGGTIYIGGINDTVYIQARTTIIGKAEFDISGTKKNIAELISYTKTITIPNSDGFGYATIPVNANALDDNTYAYTGNIATSAGSGLLFADLSQNNAGKFIVSNDLNGYVFQAPTYRTKDDYNADGVNVFSSRKRVKLNVNGLTTQNGKSCIVSVYPSVIGDETDFTISSSNIDLSNVFLKDVDSLTYPNTQNIITNVRINENLVTNGNSSVNGNSIIYGNSYLYGNVYSYEFSYLKQVGINKTDIITNTSLDVSGNVIVSKLGIGTSSVNSEPNSLEIKGNILQKNEGFIHQF